MGNISSDCCPAQRQALLFLKKDSTEAVQPVAILLVITPPKVAAHFTREMNRMWRSAELGITQRIQRKLDRQRVKRGREMERSSERLNLI